MTEFLQEETAPLLEYLDQLRAGDIGIHLAPQMGVKMQRPRIVQIVLWTNTVPVPAVSLIIGVVAIQVEVDLVLVVFLPGGLQKSVDDHPEQHPVLVLEGELQQVPQPASDLILLLSGIRIPY
ncbi:hypothetical protein ES703_32971 [subsurface metagenome]